MKYAMIYNNRSRYLNDFDEVIIKYEHKTAEVIDFIGKCKQEQRIILNIQGFQKDNLIDCKDILRAAADVHSNIAIMGDRTQTAAMKEIGLPWFYGTIADSWDMLNGFIKQGVSDVYIGNEFGFNMKKISTICKEANVNIRVYANVAQTNCPSVGDTMTQFFIRPEDIKFYEDYVDVVEFFGPLDRQDVLYDIYTNEKWAGNLKHLIIGLEQDINNLIISNHFGVIRTNCEKRCAYSNACNICNRFVSIYETVREAYDEHKVDETPV